MIPAKLATQRLRGFELIWVDDAHDASDDSHGLAHARQGIDAPWFLEEWCGCGARLAVVLFVD